MTLEKYAGKYSCFQFLKHVYKWANVFYYKSIIWIAYLTISMLLIFYSINIINSILLLFILIIIIIHSFNLQMSNREKHFTQLLNYWTFFLICVILVTTLRYVYQFSRSIFLKKYSNNS